MTPTERSRIVRLQRFIAPTPARRSATLALVIHIAIAGVVISVLCVVLALASLVVPGTPSVDAFFVTGTVASCAVSAVFFWYVRRERI